MCCGARKRSISILSFSKEYNQFPLSKKQTAFKILRKCKCFFPPYPVSYELYPTTEISLLNIQTGFISNTLINHKRAYYTWQM